MLTPEALLIPPTMRLPSESDPATKMDVSSEEGEPAAVGADVLSAHFETGVGGRT